ncbi:MAG: BACON domain-containing protein [Bacteroidaceae bacterium]|nr:BACON domain-containing protein [Bacteroidaceae bacterium]
MKLKYLFTAMASALLFASCAEEFEPAGSLDNFEASKTYVALPANGGSDTVYVNAKADWKFNNVAFDAEGKTVLIEKGDTTAAWFSVSQVEGTPGASVLVFSADATNGGREVELSINVAGLTQFMKVRQGSMEASSATCKEVIAGADGKTYRVKGVCTAIANTQYGNWYLNDGTGEVYVYGTLDKNGATKNFASLGIEVGDVVEVEGPKLTYGTTIELVDVTVVSITKSLLKVTSPEATVAKDGGKLEVAVAYKGNGAYASVPEEYQSWVSLVDSKFVPGVATKVEANPADTVKFTFNVAPNTAGSRTGQLTFKSSTGKNASEVTYKFTQEGAIANVTAAEFNAAPVGEAQYRITGMVTEIANTKYGNLYVTDWTGKVYVYGTTNFADMNLQVGSMVEMVGPRAEYKGAAQMKNAVCENVLVNATPVGGAEFNALADSNDLFYVVTGEVTKIAKEQYGNLYIKTEDGSEVYVYGTYGIWNAQGADKQYFVTNAGLEVGDTITVVGVKSSYKGAPQMVNGCCVAIQKAGN